MHLPLNDYLISITIRYRKLINKGETRMNLSDQYRADLMQVKIMYDLSGRYAISVNGYIVVAFPTRALQLAFYEKYMYVAGCLRMVTRPKKKRTC